MVGVRGRVVPLVLVVRVIVRAFFLDVPVPVPPVPPVHRSVQHPRAEPIHDERPRRDDQHDP